MNEKDLKLMVEQLVSQMVGQVDMQSVEKVVKEVSKNQSQVESDEFIPDITEIDIKKQLLVDNPADREAYLEMKAKTPARLGLGRAGARYKTITALRMRADHAAAQDSVFSDVSEEFIKKNNLIPVKTMCTDKDEYVTRPDLGRK